MKEGGVQTARHGCNCWTADCGSPPALSVTRSVQPLKDTLTVRQLEPWQVN